MGIWFGVEEPDNRSYYGGPGSWSLLVIDDPVDLMIRAEAKQVQTRLECETTVGGILLTTHKNKTSEGSVPLTCGTFVYVLSLAAISLAAAATVEILMKGTRQKIV